MGTENFFKEDTGYIQTYTGRKFYPKKPWGFNMLDIVIGLSNTCRFAGQLPQFYSVLSHSIMVARIMSDSGRGNPLEGLLHDASEGYLGDMPAPFKQFFPEFVKMENGIDLEVRKAFDLPLKKSPHCDWADRVACYIEAWYYCADKGAGMLDPDNDRPVAVELANAYPLTDHTVKDFKGYFHLYTMGKRLDNPNHNLLQ